MLPESIQQELQIICVLFTADVGGVLIMEFEPDGHLQLRVDVAEEDILFDEIGSGLKIRQLQNCLLYTSLSQQSVLRYH